MAEARLAEALTPWTHRLRVPRDVVAPVVVGCSGGPDSLALLALAVHAGLEPIAVHVDHGLRDGSEAEARVVARAARVLGARAHAVAVDVPGGSNVEGRARDERLAALERQRVEVGAAAVLLGHTADDRAETVLLNLLRGAATTGLGALADRRGTWVRPLVGLRRADTLEICRRLQLDPVADPMNDDPRFRRVWLRREVFPLLEAGSGRDLRALLARQAEIIHDEGSLLDRLAASVLEAGGASQRTLPRSVLAGPRALDRRVIRRWLGGAPPTLDEVDAVLAVGRGERAGAQLSGNRRVERTGDALHLVDLADLDQAAPRQTEFDVPGSTRIGDLTVDSWIERAPPTRWPEGAWTCVLDAEEVGDRVVIRPARPGDRLVPLGMSGAKKVSTLLAEAGVPSSRRRRAAVLTSTAGTPLWVLGYRVGAPARVTSATRRYLWFRAEPDDQRAAEASEWETLST